MYSTKPHLLRKKKNKELVQKELVHNSVQKTLQKCSSLKRREMDQMRHHSQSLNAKMLGKRQEKGGWATKLWLLKNMEKVGDDFYDFYDFSVDKVCGFEVFVHQPTRGSCEMSMSPPACHLAEAWPPGTALRNLEIISQQTIMRLSKLC